MVFIFAVNRNVLLSLFYSPMLCKKVFVFAEDQRFLVFVSRDGNSSSDVCLAMHAF